jgi:hypothetical protein
MRVGEPEAFERMEIGLDAAPIPEESLGTFFRPARAARGDWAARRGHPADEPPCRPGRDTSRVSNSTPMCPWTPCG